MHLTWIMLYKTCSLECPFRYSQHISWENIPTRVQKAYSCRLWQNNSFHLTINEFFLGIFQSLIGHCRASNIFVEIENVRLGLFNFASACETACIFIAVSLWRNSKDVSVMRLRWNAGNATFSFKHFSKGANRTGSVVKIDGSWRRSIPFHNTKNATLSTRQWRSTTSEAKCDWFTPFAAVLFTNKVTNASQIKTKILIIMISSCFCFRRNFLKSNFFIDLFTWFVFRKSLLNKTKLRLFLRRICLYFVEAGTGGPLIVGREQDSSQISPGPRIIPSRFASCHFHLPRTAINPSTRKFFSK